MGAPPTNALDTAPLSIGADVYRINKVYFAFVADPMIVISELGCFQHLVRNLTIRSDNKWTMHTLSNCYAMLPSFSIPLLANAELLT